MPRWLKALFGRGADPEPCRRPKWLSPDAPNWLSSLALSKSVAKWSVKHSGAPIASMIMVGARRSGPLKLGR
jgi:hypothetical protein